MKPKPKLRFNGASLEATEAMSIAFHSAISKLRAEDQQNEVVQLIAERIIELARTGERNPDRLCEYAISWIRG